MLPVDLTDKYIAKKCVKVQEMKWKSLSKFIINLFSACIVLSCIIMYFSWGNIFKKLKWHKAYNSPLSNQNKQEKWFSESSSLGLLFNICTTGNLLSVMRIITKTFALWPWLANLTQLRPAKTGFKNHICQEHVQVCSKTSVHMYFTTFPFFFTLSGFKNQHNRNKKKPQGPHYWVTKQCVWETPLWSFKRVKRKIPCTYSTAAGILVKGDTNPELFERWLCSGPEVGEWPGSLRNWLAGRRGGGGEWKTKCRED